VLAFADTEALRALDAITRQRPGIVALERMFAASSRGAALINRIKADPALTACEIRIVAHDDMPSRVVSRADAPVVIASEEEPAPPLDQRGTRRASRVRIADNVEVTVDGNTARLIDLSLIGAQVVSQVILRPNQRVRLTVPDSPRAVRISASVAWASFEMPKGTPAPQYRAGLNFLDADADALQQFMDRNKG
jgi:hypothetical protein